MIVVFEKKNQSYKRYLKKEGLIELDRLRLENKKEWIISHILGFTEHENMIKKTSALTKRVYQLEKTVQALQDLINNKEM